MNEQNANFALFAFNFALQYLPYSIIFYIPVIILYTGIFGLTYDIDQIFQQSSCL